MRKKNNSNYIKYLKIRENNSQDFFKFLKKFFTNTKIINYKYKILKKGKYKLYPLIKNKDLINKFIESNDFSFNYQIVTEKKQLNPKYKYKTLEDALQHVLPNNYSQLIPHSYDIIGDIAITEFNNIKDFNDKEINILKKKIARAITLVNKKVRAVYEKTSEIKGPFRLRDLNLIYGDEEPIVEYKENDCIFRLDIKRTFFTPRLIFERNRISNLNFKEKEIIADLFAGVGPFTIQIAKKNDVVIHAFDINQLAYKFIKENIKLNKLIGKVFKYNIDIQVLLNPENELGNSLKNTFDRIIMNLPENSLNFLKVACFLLKSTGGIIHIYQFSKKPNSIENSLYLLQIEINKINWQIKKILFSKIVKSYSPNTDITVLDVLINPKN